MNERTWPKPQGGVWRRTFPGTHDHGKHEGNEGTWLKPHNERGYKNEWMWPEEPRQDWCPKYTYKNEGKWPEEPHKDKEWMCHEAPNERKWQEPQEKKEKRKKNKGKNEKKNKTKNKKKERRGNEGAWSRTFSGTPDHGNKGRKRASQQKERMCSLEAR